MRRWYRKLSFASIFIDFHSCFFGKYELSSIIDPLRVAASTGHEKCDL